MTRTRSRCFELARKRLSSYAGSRKTIDVTRLAHDLNLEIPEESKLGSKYNSSDRSMVINPNQRVWTRQGKVKVEYVARYIDQLEAFGSLPPIMVSHEDGGETWHLDGLHRLIASRLVGRSVAAKIWVRC